MIYDGICSLSLQALGLSTLNLARVIEVLTFRSRSRMEMYLGTTDILLRQTRSSIACGMYLRSLDRYKSKVV